MIAILASIAPFLPLILQVIAVVIGKNAENIKLQQAFLDFTQQMQAAGLISVDLHNSFQSQAKANADKAAAKYAAEQAAKNAPKV